MTLSIPHPASEQGKLISNHTHEYEHCLFAHVAGGAAVVRPLPFASHFNRILSSACSSSFKYEHEVCGIHI